ncbi:MAG TPA: hypothetical protein VLA76_06130 [Candidatus Angelobacter sp.]|nr:hypothetical protein [Candidatus Angelobacter sp.]
MNEIVDWLLRLGDEYGVDPILYALIWVGALPLFLLSIGWLVRALRRRESILLPLASTAFFFSAPTLYVVAAGRDLPWWVYVVLAVLAAVGAVRTALGVRRRLARGEELGERRPPDAARS